MMKGCDGKQRSDVEEFSKPDVQHNGDGSFYHRNDLEYSNKSVNAEAVVENKSIDDKESTNDKGIVGSIRKWLIIPICLLYFGAFSISFLTIQQFVYVKIQREKYPDLIFNTSIPACHANESDPKYESQTQIQQESAEWMSYFALAFGIPAIFSDLILGSYTDRFGRKFLFFLPCIGSFLHIAINVVGIYTDFALHWFIPVSIVDGLSGHIFGLLLVTFSYIADITKPGKERSLGIVIVELVIGIAVAGFSFGTGYFIQNLGFLWPMFTAAILTALTIILVILIPETYTKEKRVETSSAWGNLYSAFKLFFGKENSGKRWIYNILIVTFTLTIFSVFGRSNVEILYQLNNPFCWDPQRLSWFVALRSGAQQILGMSLVKPLQYIFSDESIAMLGCMSLIAGFTMEGLAQSDGVLYGSAAASSLGMLTIPVVRAIMSKLTSADKQGAVFASLACVEAAASVAGTVIANAIYDKTISFFKGFVFFVFVMCNAVSFILMLIYKIGSSRRSHGKP